MKNMELVDKNENLNNSLSKQADEILIYQTEDGTIKVDVLQKIYEEGELVEANTMRKVGNPDFSTKPTSMYNLDVIISVGYRVHSKQGTQFRIWATQRLREYCCLAHARAKFKYAQEQGQDERATYFLEWDFCCNRSRRCWE